MNKRTLKIIAAIATVTVAAIIATICLTSTAPKGNYYFYFDQPDDIKQLGTLMSNVREDPALLAYLRFNLNLIDAKNNNDLNVYIKELEAKTDAEYQALADETIEILFDRLNGGHVAITQDYSWKRNLRRTTQRKSQTEWSLAFYPISDSPLTNGNSDD